MASPMSQQQSPVLAAGGPVARPGRGEGRIPHAEVGQRPVHGHRPVGFGLRVVQVAPGHQDVLPGAAGPEAQLGQVEPEGLSVDGLLHSHALEGDQRARVGAQGDLDALAQRELAFGRLGGEQARGGIVEGPVVGRVLPGRSRHNAEGIVHVHRNDV